MADDDTIFRKRLLTRSSALGKTGIKKFAEGLLALVDDKAATDPTARKIELDAVLWELEQLEFDASRTSVLRHTCHKELDNYTALHADIDKSVESVSKEIEELKQTLRQEKVMRAYKEEYESIARVVNRLPSRKEMAEEMAAEERKMEEARSRQDLVDRQMEQRQKQAALLMRTIENLKATLDEDDILQEQEEQSAEEEEAQDEDMEKETPAPPPPSRSSMSMSMLLT